MRIDKPPRKKILFLTPHMISGGVEKSLINLLHCLPEEAYEVTVMMVKARGPFLKYIPDWVKIEELPLSEDTKTELLTGGARASVLRYLKKKDYFKALQVFLKKTLLKDPVPELMQPFSTVEELGNPFDFAIVYHMHMPFLIKYGAHRVQASKKAAWIHNDFSNSGFNPKPISKDLECFNYFFAVSTQLEAEFKTFFPELGNRTRVMYNIISRNTIYSLAKSEKVSFPHLKENETALLSIGRLDKQKGFDLAVKVCANLKKRGYAIKWYVLGEGKERKKLEELIKSYGVQDYFFLEGFKENPYPYLMKCDLYIQPSRHEGYCTTVIEAKCLAKPIISTRVAGAEEQINPNETGLLVHFDGNEMTAAVEHMLNNVQLREMFTERLKKQQIDTDIEINKLMNLINEIET